MIGAAALSRRSAGEVATLWRAPLLALLAVFAACQTPPSQSNPAIAPGDGPQVEALWDSHRREVEALTHFTLTGRVASDGVNGGSGGIHWSQQGDRLDLRFSGPLGVGAIALTGTLDDLQLRDRDGVVHIDDADTRLRASLGWSVPLVALRDWIVGLPAPSFGVDGQLLDIRGRLLRLDQAGWQLDYLDYRAVPIPGADSMDLPRRIALTDGQRHLRVVIDEWNLASEAPP